MSFHHLSQPSLSLLGLRLCKGMSKLSAQARHVHLLLSLPPLLSLWLPVFASCTMPACSCPPTAQPLWDRTARNLSIKQHFASRICETVTFFAETRNIQHTRKTRGKREPWQAHCPSAVSKTQPAGRFVSSRPKRWPSRKSSPPRSRVR